MSTINITIAVPLSAIATIKDPSTSLEAKTTALHTTTRAVYATISALPYDITTHTIDERSEAPPSRSAAFTSNHSHPASDTTFTITVIHRSDAHPAAILKVHASTTVKELVGLIEEATEVDKYAQYLVFEHRPFWDGARGSYDGDVTLGEVSLLPLLLLGKA
jgi:hypothetical protein